MNWPQTIEATHASFQWHSRIVWPTLSTTAFRFISIKAETLTSMLRWWMPQTKACNAHWLSAYLWSLWNLHFRTYRPAAHQIHPCLALSGQPPLSLKRDSKVATVSQSCPRSKHGMSTPGLPEWMQELLSNTATWPWLMYQTAPSTECKSPSMPKT